jgi:hypothetical protein
MEHGKGTSGGEFDLFPVESEFASKLTDRLQEDEILTLVEAVQ